jgi:hypothetical protein
VFVNSPVLRGERGLDVFGLLVRVCGRIGADQGNGVYSLSDGGGTIYVQTNGVAMPAQPGTMVAITGVATISDGTPLLLLANENDIQTFTE